MNALNQQLRNMQNTQKRQQPDNNKAANPNPKQPEEETKTEETEQPKTQYHKNLCLEHFPEPIIMTYDKPLCKKCIPEYISSKSKPSQDVSSQQKMNNARLLGMGSLALNQFQSEKSQISRSLERISNLKRDFRILDQEI